MAYVHLVVDLIGRSTLKSSCLSQTYSDALSHLYQTAVDICVNGETFGASTLVYYHGYYLKLKYKLTISFFF